MVCIHEEQPQTILNWILTPLLLYSTLISPSKTFLIIILASFLLAFDSSRLYKEEMSNAFLIQIFPFHFSFSPDSSRFFPIHQNVF